jgi:uncharacterized repeat protein (TIGR03803 family)
MTTRAFRMPIIIAAVFVAAATAQTRAEFPVTTLASFDGTNGWEPNGGLVLSGNTLYGTSFSGGVPGCGNVYSLPVTGGIPTIVASFHGNDGQNPVGGLTLLGNKLYGTVQSIGGWGYGEVYSVPVAGGSPSTLLPFNGPNGAIPQAGVTFSTDGRTLYGTTSQGGPAFSHTAQSYGTVFSFSTNGGNQTILASFNGTNGSYPAARLTLSPDGKTLYGTTSCGGLNFTGDLFSGFGTVFSVPVNGGTPSVLAVFNGTNGWSPSGRLTLSADGRTLFGTTSFGGPSYDSSNDGWGTVYSVPITGGTPTVLASFDGNNGAYPRGGLTLSADGTMFYGTANNVFSVPVTGGTPTIIASLDALDEEVSSSDLALSLDGKTLYGTTDSGGAYGYGTVFSVDLTAPEPASLTLLGLGAGALLTRRHRRKR